MFIIPGNNNTCTHNVSFINILKAVDVASFSWQGYFKVMEKDSFFFCWLVLCNLYPTYMVSSTGTVVCIHGVEREEWCDEWVSPKLKIKKVQVVIIPPVATSSNNRLHIILNLQTQPSITQSFWLITSKMTSPSLLKSSSSSTDSSGGKLSATILSVYDIPTERDGSWPVPSYVSMTVLGKEVKTGKPCAKKKSTNTFKFVTSDKSYTGPGELLLDSVLIEVAVRSMLLFSSDERMNRNNYIRSQIDFRRFRKLWK